jgi:hypothetical protein
MFLRSLPTSSTSFSLVTRSISRFHHVPRRSFDFRLVRNLHHSPNPSRRLRSRLSSLATGGASLALCSSLFVLSPSSPEDNEQHSHHSSPPHPDFYKYFPTLSDTSLSSTSHLEALPLGRLYAAYVVYLLSSSEWLVANGNTIFDGFSWTKDHIPILGGLIWKIATGVRILSP